MCEDYALSVPCIISISNTAAERQRQFIYSKLTTPYHSDFINMYAQLDCYKHLGASLSEQLEQTDARHIAGHVASHIAGQATYPGMVHGSKR